MTTRHIFLLMQFNPSTSRTYPVAAYNNAHEADKWCAKWNEEDGDGPVRYMVQSIRFFEGGETCQ